MAERGGLNFRSWRPRGRGRARGRSKELWWNVHPPVAGRLGQLTSNQPTNHGPPLLLDPKVEELKEGKNLPHQLERGKSHLTCSPEDAYSPESSSSSKRSCTEMEENEDTEDKLFVKRRCKKILSASFPRDSDSISTEMSAGDSIMSQICTVRNEKWEDIVDEKDNAVGEPCGNSLEMVQDSYPSSGSNEAEMCDGKSGIVIKENLDFNMEHVCKSGKDLGDLEVNSLLNAVTENCICTSDGDTPSSKKTAVPGIHSMSSPSAGSKQRPHIAGRSKSDSWINDLSPASSRKKERTKKRQKSSTIPEWQESSDEEIETRKRNVSSTRSKSTGLRSNRPAPQNDMQTEGESLFGPESDDICLKIKSTEFRDASCDSEVCDADVESSQYEDCYDSFSVSEDENWEHVVKKLSAEGVDTQDVQSTQSKITQVHEKEAAVRQKHMQEMVNPSQSVYNPMDAPLQFRSSFRARNPNAHPFYKYNMAYDYRSAVNCQYGPVLPPPPPPHMWAAMANPYFPPQPSMFHQYQAYPGPPFTVPYQEHFPQPQNSSVGEAENKVTEDKAAFQQAHSFCSSDWVSEQNMERDSLDANSVVCTQEPECSYPADDCGSLDEYRDQHFSPELKSSYPQHLIPRQVRVNAMSANKRLASNAGNGRSFEHPEYEEYQEYDAIGSGGVLTSTEDSAWQNSDISSSTDNATMDNLAPNLQKNWYNDIEVVTKRFDSAQRKNRIWGKNLQQMKAVQKEPSKPTFVPVSAQSVSVAAGKVNPPSYANVLASSRRNSSLSGSNTEPLGSTSRCSSLKGNSSSNPFWHSPPVFKEKDPVNAYRQWSVGSQGWNTDPATSIPRRVSEPPKPKTFAEILQRPRRLSLEAQVRGESVQRMASSSWRSKSMANNTLGEEQVTSWRSASVSEDILEVQYPVCDIDYIDTHCHIDLLFQRSNHKGTFAKFALINKFPLNFAGCVAIFCYPFNFSSTYTLAQDLLKEPNIWGSFGCHPHQVKHYDGVLEAKILEYMEHPKTVALGEIGLDYSNRPLEVTSDHELQKMIFRRQLQLALDVRKPLVIHCRDAEEDTLHIMTDMVPRNHKIHRHCFTGPPEDAIAFLRAFPNSFIGLTALVTFPTATNTHQTARAIPLNRLLLETDTPYFVPKKVRGTKWSHPAMAVHVAERIAQLRGIPLEDVLTAVRANTMTMYGI